MVWLAIMRQAIVTGGVAAAQENDIQASAPAATPAATPIATPAENVQTATEPEAQEEAGQPETVTTEPEATGTATPEESTYENTAESAGLEIAEEDAEMLMRLAMAEAEGESVEGKALVMLVVLNRVEAEAFPDTVEEVIFQKNQFSVTNAGGRYWTREPDESCQEALELVKQGWDESEGALYFESCNGSSWHSRNLEFLFQAGNHRFYR